MADGLIPGVGSLMETKEQFVYFRIWCDNPETVGVAGCHRATPKWARLRGTVMSLGVVAIQVQVS